MPLLGSGELPARPHEVVVSAQHSKKPAGFQLDRISLLPRNRLSQG
jgi:hypothetical protein